MLKKRSFINRFLSTFSLSLAQHHEAAAETKPATETKVVSAEEAEKRTNKERK